MKMSVECRVSSVEMSAVNAAHPRCVSRFTRHASLLNLRHLTPATPHASRFTSHASTLNPQPSTGFTLIELLVVISILGILAALTLPALKNFAKSDATLSASRQLLDDVAHARQLAISQRTTVYMVFVPMNFWGNDTNAFLATLTNAAEQTAAGNLCDKQLTGYTFVTLRTVGDQPGQGVPRYLAPWQNLPEGAFIATNKFNYGQYYYIAQYDPNVSIYGFVTNAPMPFPTADAPRILMPWIAFNYLGQTHHQWRGHGQRRRIHPARQRQRIAGTGPGHQGAANDTAGRHGNAARQQHQHFLQHRPH